MTTRDSIGDWPYNVWNSIIASFSAILSDDDIIVESKRKKCASFLEKLSNNCKWLVPVKNPHSTEYESIVNDCECFNIWLFGQLFSVFHRDYLENNQEKCIDTQIKLLQYLWENDPPMYRILFRCYLNVLLDVCEAFNRKDGVFQPTTYSWFDFTSNEKLPLPKTTFRIENSAHLLELTKIISTLFVSQIPFIFNICPSIPLHVWKCSLSLWRNCPNKSPAYRLISYLLLNDLSITESQYNPIMVEVSLHVLDDVSTLCQVGKLPQEEDFCSMLDILCDTSCLPLCVDFGYVHQMYFLLLQSNALLNELIEETVFRFFNKLLGVSYFDETAINLERNLQCINLSLLRSLLQFTVEESMRHDDNDQSAKTVNIHQTNEIWKFLLEQTLDQIQNVTASNAKQVINTFKFVHSLTRSAVSITYQFRAKFIFFEMKIYEILIELTKICENRVDEKLFYLLLDIVKDVLMLNESLHFDPKVQMWLLQLLYRRWVSHSPADALYQKFAPLVNEKLREYCVVNIMWTHRYQFDSWKNDFFDEILKNCSVNILKAVPVFVSSLNDRDVHLFVDRLLDCNSETLIELSTFIRPVICALAGNGILAKLSTSDVDLYCRLCDRELVAPSVVCDVDRHDILNRFIVRIMQTSEVARYNVISAVAYVFNHVSKSDELMSVLRDCFLSENRKIREKIIEVTPYIIFKDLDAENYDYDESVFQSFRKCLRAVTLFALANEDVTLQYLCLNSITKIGCVPLEITLLPSVTMLLTLTLNGASSYTPLAKASIQQVAIAHNVEVEDHIYLKYAEYVFPLVARIIVLNYSTYGVSVSNLPYDHNSVFNNLTVNHVLQYLLPYIAENQDLHPLIDELSALCGMSKAQLLRNAFKQVFPHVMLFGQTKTVQNVMGILYKETSNTITDLLSCCVTKVLAELFIYYEEYEEKVKWVLSEIKRLATSSKNETTRRITDVNIESFLQSRFFGVLMKLENQLCTVMISDTSRRRVLSSFKSLIQFMSSAYITSVRFKVLFTLRTITDGQKNMFPALCVQIWEAFVRRIEIALLGPILSNIFASLLPFTRSHSSHVNQIFRYLVVENCAAVSDHLMQLYFVPTALCDPDIVPVIRRADADLKKMHLEVRLEWLLEATKHEITEIKLHALRRLRMELADNRKDISRLILASDSVSSLIFRVLDILVEGFRNLDPNIQEASGICLGEFGAIDPSYIPNTVIKVDDAKKYNCYQIDDVDFVVKAFTLLCRGFQMAKSSSNMDTFALAIQSLLTSYEVKPDEQCKYWSQISKHLREIIMPFYSTTYTLLTHANESSYDIPHLVYGSNKALTVQKWAYNWSNFLISLLPADSKAKEVFTYCKGPMSCEIECMQLFLPHILLNALLASDDANLSKIYEEMISVIRYDKNGVEEENSPQKTSTQLIASEELSVISNMDVEMGVICTKTMFNLLDVLYKKYRNMKCELKGRPNPDCRKLAKFLEKFSKYQLAEKSFERKEYVRSLLYLEEFLSADDVDLDRYLVLLAKIYVHLNDVDNVKGLFAAHSMKLRQLQNVIMVHEITDQFQDAAICYQQLLQQTADEERTLVYEKRMIQCYLAMNQPETALRFVNSLSTTAGSAKNVKVFYDVECEALWNLSQFDKLEKLTGSKSAQLDDTWGVRIGQSIVHFLNGDKRGLADELRRIRSTLTKSLHMSTAAFGGYRESYEHAIRLHILNEFEKVADLVFSVDNDGEGVNGRLSDVDWRRKFRFVVDVEFEERLNKLQPTSRALQPVLNVRQTLFSIASRWLANRRPELAPLFDEEKHKCWLKVIEIANRARNFQLAYSNIVAIDAYQLKGFFIEKAKYYWEKMEQQEALRTLQHGLQFHFSDYAELCKQPHRADEQKICAEAYMLLGTYNDAVANTDISTNFEYFRRACLVWRQSEKTFVKLAQYQDKIVCGGEKPAEIYRRNFDKHAFVVEMFGKSLMFGCEFIYQSLSRMLNVWLDFAKCSIDERRNNATAGTAAAHAAKMAVEERRKAFQKMQQVVNESLARLPTYYFLTAFSLILSRISHPSDDCFAALKQIVIQCTLNFPNQTLWRSMSLYRSRPADGVAGRLQHERVNRVLNDANLLPLRSTIGKYEELFEELSRLCHAPKKQNLAQGPKLLSAFMRRDSPLLRRGHFDDVLIPAQKFLTIVLPRQLGSGTLRDADPAYNPFPEKMVFVAGCENEAVVYSSMQRPVRVGLVGTDGRVYPMIFKGVDDMRIDSRAMEFNSVVNMYLKRDVEGRDRGLHVRTYTVLPLVGKSGIIEFIPQLDTMRTITSRMRRSLGINDAKIVNEFKYGADDSVDKKRECFLRLRELHPPVLQEWYKLEFPNPSSWYTARSAYVRTLAVMSIVGYTLGLGDRHNDNILLDYTNGDVIHVDFNALFNKGETLPVPERVPFRLTHSMVKAMGPLGYEGAFQYTCEIVARIMRGRKDQLISVLNTFLYDPLDFFVDSSARRRNSAMDMYTAAESNLRNVEARINGVVRSFTKGDSIPLSVEGQTRKLIEEATDINNLIHMFMGWGAYI